MTVQRQLTYWAIGFLVFVLIVYLLRGILLPFIAGMALAYLLDPIADRFERLGLSRIAATAIILCLSLLIFVLAFAILAPLLGDQIARLGQQLPELLTALEDMFQEQGTWIRSLIGDDINLSGQISGIAKEALGWAAAVFKSLWSGGLALFNLISLVVVTPVVAFYLLADWDRMLGELDSWLPRDYADTIREIAGDIDRVLAAFVRGQSTVCLVLGIFYAVALTIVGLRFGLLIGLVAGIVSFIPFVGAITGLVLSVGAAILQTWPSIDWVFVLVVAAVFAVGQFLEGNILSPRLLGDRVGLHPVWLMFALFAFGYLFGFVGMLIAVPISASIGVILRFLLRQYLSSRLYTGTGGGGRAAASDEV